MNSHDFRETKIRVDGVEQTIRTERTSTVKRLETDHTKAVKAALVARRTEVLSIVFDPDKAAKMAKAATVFPACNWVDARKGFPKAPTGKPIPDYLVEVAPGHYATAEAAKSMGAEELFEEVLPGLRVCRYADGTRWTLRLAGTVTEEKPEGTHLGPLFKSRDRARQVALDELSGFDWTRPADELKADEAAGTTVRFIKWREHVARKPSDTWAWEQLREAEAALKAFQRSHSSVC
ncbi:hypothetical protein [Streptomyces sp. NBC_01768]|uniref:hypothetical protein n=1 Tax=Streptomyces sp. NBC_01768 TaxID=2975938 RepID=UPI002DDA7A67|nr:hypothetical protein [Streptomyces sp. NBC_01768]WSC31831.1 hypothetical protein OG902_36860 [Streptomyces sp. NBC_01768]